MNTCVVVKKDLIAETLKAKAKQGKGLVEPFCSFALEHKLPFKILEDKEATNDAEVHKKEGDLWYCLQGETQFIYGGELVNPKMVVNNGVVNENELKAKEILGGTSVVLSPGDWLWIPAGQPHVHHCQKTSRLIIIKIPTQ